MQIPTASVASNAILISIPRTSERSDGGPVTSGPLGFVLTDLLLDMLQLLFKKCRVLWGIQREIAREARLRTSRIITCPGAVIESLRGVGGTGWKLRAPSIMHHALFGISFALCLFFAYAV
jgi:hypothetical protein